MSNPDAHDAHIDLKTVALAVLVYFAVNGLWLMLTT